MDIIGFVLFGFGVANSNSVLLAIASICLIVSYTFCLYRANKKGNMNIYKLIMSIIGYACAAISIAKIVLR